MYSNKVTVSNKKLGNDTESEFIELARTDGWWVHLFATKISGQPFDCILAKNNEVYFVDVKHVKAGIDYFLHSRIENNQRNAFTMLKNRNFKKIGFVIKFEDYGWYYLPFNDVDFTQTKTNIDKMKPLY